MSTSSMPDEPHTGTTARKIVSARKPFPAPRLMKATTCSYCCETSATKSGLPSSLRSTIGTWIPPGRASTG